MKFKNTLSISLNRSLVLLRYYAESVDHLGQDRISNSHFFQPMSTGYIFIHDRVTGFTLYINTSSILYQHKLLTPESNNSLTTAASDHC